MDAITAMHGRRSIRAYQPSLVPRETIETLVWAAIHAPTPPPSGDSPWSVCVVEGVERIAAYGERARDYANSHQPPGNPWTWTTRPGFKVFWDAPAVVLFCARRGHADSPFDCCRAGQNFEVAAHSIGLGSCWVGSPLPWLRSPGVGEELGIPAGHDAEAVIAFGVPAERPAGKPRGRPAIHWL